ncbi:MAG: ABC transporter, partial [Alphaproteobacteria bacterium]|nr:ABC transporter [Alphaproteobacteria bacterium]
MKLAPFNKISRNLFNPLTLRQWLMLLALSLVLFFAILPWVRMVKYDATADRLFTLSAGTKQVLSRIHEPLTFKLYYSEQLGRVVPAYASYATRVTDLLRELQQQAHGKIKLEIVNPIPFSEEEDRAIAFGLKAVPISQQESVFFGLVASNALDTVEGIPFFQPDRETFLEYDLARLIERLTRKQKPVIGLFSGLPIMGDTAGLMAGTPTQPWIIYNQLARDYDVRLISSDGAGIDDNLDLLMIVQPRNINEQAIFRIDQYALSKGRIVALLDPLPETELGGLNIGRPPSYLEDGLLALFHHWGVNVAKEQIVLDPATARPITVKQGEGAIRTNYLPWLGVGSGLMKRDDLMTSDLSALNFASAGYLEPVEGATTQFTPLVTSSDQVSLLPRTALRNLTNPNDLYDKQSPAGKKLPLIARVTGTVTSLYANQPNNPFVQQAGQAFKASSSQDLRMVVIADSDFLANDQWLELQEFYGQAVGQPKANNGDLLFNVLDNLVGSD